MSQCSGKKRSRCFFERLEKYAGKECRKLEKELEHNVKILNRIQQQKSNCKSKNFYNAIKDVFKGSTDYFVSLSLSENDDPLAKEYLFRDSSRFLQRKKDVGLVEDDDSDEIDDTLDGEHWVKMSLHTTTSTAEAVQLIGECKLLWDEMANFASQHDEQLFKKIKEKMALALKSSQEYKNWNAD